MLRAVVTIIFLASFPSFGHEIISGHIRVSSYLNPLAEIPGVAVLTSGLIEAEYVAGISREYQLNFTYKMIPPPDILAVGTMLENGTWTGAMGQLQRKEVDVVVSLVTMTPLKYSVADPCLPLFYEETVIVIPYAKHQSTTNIASPFSPVTWLLMFIALAISSFFIIIFHKETKHSKVFWVIAMISVFADSRVPMFGKKNFHHPRIIFACWLLGAVLIKTYYVAEITAMVATPNNVFTYESIEDVAKDSDRVTVLVEKGSASEEFFMTSDNPAMKRLADQLRRHPERLFRYDTDLRAMYDRVDEKTVLIQPKVVAQGMIYEDYMDHDHSCQLTIAPKGFHPKAQGLAFPKGSKLADDFTGEILDQIRFGTLDFIQRLVLNTKREPCTTLSDGHPSDLLLMTNLQGAFYLLFAGYSLAFLVFLAEHIRFRLNERRTRNTVADSSGPGI